MSTCNRLDLQTPGSQPSVPKNPLDHLWGDKPMFPAANSSGGFHPKSYQTGKVKPYVLKFLVTLHVQMSRCFR
jgi:hypothetical protein